MHSLELLVGLRETNLFRGTFKVNVTCTWSSDAFSAAPPTWDDSDARRQCHPAATRIDISPEKQVILKTTGMGF